MALVSIIIPCFNAAPFIAQCLKSCFEQTYPNTEIILIDNNSTDESVDIASALAIKEKKDISIVRCRQQGIKYARSLGNELAKGKYIQMLDADDELGPDKIANQVAALEEAGNYSVAYCDWRWRFFRPDGNSYTVKFVSKQFKDFLLQLLLDNWHPPLVYLFRRDVVEAVNPVYAQNSDKSSSEDREFATLAALTGSRFLYVPESFVYYNNWSSQQVTHTITNKERMESLEQIFGRLKEYARKQAKADLQELHWHLLEQSWKPYKLAVGKLAVQNSVYKTTGQGKDGPIKISPQEAELIEILQLYSGAFCLEHHARQILRILHRKAFQELRTNYRLPSWQDIVQRVNTLLSTEHEKKDNIANSCSFDEDQSLDIPNSLEMQFLLKGPLYLPTFPVQRLLILTMLEELCHKRILTET